LPGEGLAAALVGAQVVVDVANAPSWEDKAVLEFFETSGRNLLAAEGAAGVGHHVALSVVGTDRLLAGNPQLGHSIKYRFPYLDPLNHIQIELLRRFRAGDRDERSRRGIHLTINGIAAGLRNSG